MNIGENVLHSKDLKKIILTREAHTNGFDYLMVSTENIKKN